MDFLFVCTDQKFLITSPDLSIAHLSEKTKDFCANGCFDTYFFLALNRLKPTIDMKIPLSRELWGIFNFKQLSFNGRFHVFILLICTSPMAHFIATGCMLSLFKIKANYRQLIIPRGPGPRGIFI
jgi:hypothetical protein